jgi:tellurite resistance protein
MAKPTTPKPSELEKHAAAIRAELNVPRQSEIFRAAVEAGFLVALADGTIDDDERAAIVRAVEILSVGAVIEWEADTLVDECAERADKDGVEARAAAVGAELKALGHPEAGLLFAATIARASKGVDKNEAELLKTIGVAAGLTPDAVKGIVKRAAGGTG